MITAIYIFWGLVPVFFLIMWTVSSLERNIGKKKTETPGDFLKSFLFTLGCLGILFVLDLYVLDFLTEDIFLEFLPRQMVLFLTYPLLLWLGAKAVGGSEPIRITKAPGRKFLVRKSTVFCEELWCANDRSTMISGQVSEAAANVPAANVAAARSGDRVQENWLFSA